MRTYCARSRGAEAAVAVNNNAAALLLILCTLAQGGGDRLPRRAGGDRWSVPDSGCDETKRSRACGSGDDEPDKGFQIMRLR